MVRQSTLREFADAVKARPRLACPNDQVPDLRTGCGGGGAHAGVLLLLSLVALRYVDEARLAEWLKALVRSFLPLSAILLPAAFFLSVFQPDARHPNSFIYLAYGGASLLAIGVVLLGVGLLR